MSTKNCAVANCKAQAFKHGYCVDHYRLNPSQTAQPDGFTDDEVAKFKQTFSEFDSDGNGTIDQKELQRAITKTGAAQPTKVEIDELLAEVDLNRNGGIELDEFLTMISKIRSGQLKSKSGMANNLKSRFEQKAKELTAVKAAPKAEKKITKYEWDSANTTSNADGKFKKGKKGVKITYNDLPAKKNLSDLP